MFFPFNTSDINKTPQNTMQEKFIFKPDPSKPEEMWFSKMLIKFYFTVAIVIALMVLAAPFYTGQWNDRSGPGCLDTWELVDGKRKYHCPDWFEIPEWAQQ